MWKYKGGGFVPGIPARDLSDEEVQAIGEDVLKASGLYEKVENRREKPRASEDKLARGESEDK
jgi:hypothetical protein